MRALLALVLAVAPLANVPAAGAPDDPDLRDARAAWRYFVENTHPATGLVSSVAGYPSTTAWDTGSAILATLAAGELEILSDEEVVARLGTLLRTLETLPLFDGALPNKAYQTGTAAMADYENHPAPSGIGTSAVDVGRLALALVLAGDLQPELREPILKALARWDTCRLVQRGELYGVHRDRAGRLAPLQEGRLGYEQYAAKALALLGVDAPRARSYERFLAEVKLLGVPVPHDARDRRSHGAVDALVSEPWVLDGLELGLGGGGAPLARRVFEVQKRRWQETGIPTALSEDHLDRAPWFVYDAILADGVPWKTVGPSGEDAPGLRGLSTKAAFGLAALHADDPYARVLLEAARRTRDAEHGFRAGLYEAGGVNGALTANTNAVILEAILYRRTGPLDRLCPDCRAWREQVAGLAARRGVCPAADLGSAGPGPRPDLGALPPAGPVPGPGPAARGGSRSGPRVDGAFLGTYRGVDRQGFGGLATVRPWRATFLRLGAEATPRSPYGDTRLMWGIGWDDWRDGTLTLQVNNWGPLSAEQAPGWRGAEANLGYKLPRWCSGWLCVAPVAAITVPFAGGPYADLRFTFTIFRRLFMMGGIGRTLPARGALTPPVGTPDWRMVYGFGIQDWKPGSLFVTYHDWGPDWRAHNGLLAVGMNWSF